MADTTSIASRMEKLAKLKRMKQGLSAPATVAAKPTPEPEIAPEDETAVAAASVTQAPTGTPDISAMIQEEMAMEATAPVEQFDNEPVEQLDNEPVEQVVPDADEQSNAEANEQVVSEADEQSNAEANEQFVSEANEQFDNEAAEQFADEAAEESEPVSTVEAPANIDMEGASPNEAILLGSDETGAPEENVLGDDSSNELSAAELDEDDDLGDEIPADLQGDDSSELEAADVSVAEQETAALDEVAAMDAGDDAPLPDFAAREIDPEVLAHEFGADNEAEPDAPIASETAEGRVAVTFDESRTTLLNHVSRQMNCSVEDVVVTALDWYLDALFGEDGEAKTG